MLPQTRQMWKDALWWTRIKVVYQRITFTRFTTLFFFFALLNCIILVILQAIAYADNVLAVQVIGDLLSQSQVPEGLPVYSNGVLQLCDSVPGQKGTTCNTVPSYNSALNQSLPTSRDIANEFLVRSLKERRQFRHSGDDDMRAIESEEEEEAEEEVEEEHRNHDSGLPKQNNGTTINKDGTPPIRPTSSLPTTTPSTHEDTASTQQPESANGEETRTSAANAVGPESVPCAQNLMWLQHVLKDSKREDIVNLLFNIWLFSITVVTILNESLPHLGASVAGHILGTAWAGYRVSTMDRLRHRYIELVVNGACQTDFMGSWWDQRNSHTIPIVCINVIALVAMGYLSFMLFKVYASQSFSRVGACLKVSRIYKIVLVFSACLQLTAFFSLASTAMWIDHITHGVIGTMTRRGNLFLGAFIITLFLLLPWLYLGWVSVRKEGRKRFIVFTVISFFLIIVASLLFTSPVYRFIFMTWTFFATVTVTSFILIVVTTLLGVWCRVNFDEGLAHFLQVSEALEDVNFTPVYFSGDSEKGNTFKVSLNQTLYEKDSKHSSETSVDSIQQPELSYNSHRAPRGESVYSETTGAPVKLSSTPSLFQERDRAAARAASARRNRAFGGAPLNLGSDGYTQPQIPLRSATSLSSRSRTSTLRRSRDLTPSPRLSIVSSVIPSRSGTPYPSSPTSIRTPTPPAVPLRPSGLPGNPRPRAPVV